VIAPSQELLRLEDALERMLAGVAPLTAESVQLRDALGRVLAADVTARITLPPWDNSAMDGFAVRSGDVASAVPDRPVSLRVIGEVAAGHPPTDTVTAGTAIRILTGGMMPPGADAVVPVEDTDAPLGEAALPDTVEVRASAAAGAHVRARGSDLGEGDHLLDAGTPVRPAIVGLLAASGYGAVIVHRRPRVAILATGDELVPPGKPLGPAQIPDSNTSSLEAQARATGAEVIPLGVVRDDRASILDHLRAGVENADVVVASGGVSVGAHDEVKAAFEELGELDLWRVAVQPGKPLAFGRAGDTLFFGLPGNPVSSFVTFELFVRPVIRRLAGHRDLSGRSLVTARLLDTAQTSPGRRAFLRVRLGTDPDAPDRLVARLAGGQGSHVLSALALADGLAVVPEETVDVVAGTQVSVIRLDQEAA
jgi:molybdopterin molybdotransferase